MFTINIVFVCVLLSSVIIIVSTKSTLNSWITLSANDINGVLSGGEVDLSDPSRSGNYTVTYVPLISVIANYMPEFLKRLKTQDIISARSLNWLITDRVEICASHHLGRFPNPDNRCQFFECAMNFKNILNCSRTNPTMGNSFNSVSNDGIDDVIQLKSRIEPKDIRSTNRLTSSAVVYRINECVSLILHQCSPDYIYSNRLQRCVPHKEASCSD